MITSVQGNLLESDAEALVNTVNTVGVMGKGIALQFREAFPDNFRLYKIACAKKEVKVGRMFITQEHSLGGTKTIVNFPTKTTWRLPSEYSYIADGLVALRGEIVTRSIKSIAIPPLGSNNGGLDWHRVRNMIVESLQDIDCDVRLYEPSDAIVEKMKAERVQLTPARVMLLDIMCDMLGDDEFPSVFAAEKAVYFLQRFGATDIFKVNFQKYFYGPYSGGVVSHVLYHLNGSYIKGMTGMQQKPFEPLRLMDDTQEIVKQFLDNSDNSRYKDICEQTKAFLRGFYSPAPLEMLATIDFLLRFNPLYQDWNSKTTDDTDELVPQIMASLHDWSRRKERLFSDTVKIKIVLQHLLKYPAA